MEFCELRYQDPRTRTYLGSPSLLRAPSGALIATHDYFGPGSPKNREEAEHLTSVYRSEDDGASWQNISHLADAFFSNLFLHRGAVYLLGVSQEYGSIVIRRTDDEGFTWTEPRDTGSGLLFPGGPRHDPPNYHCGVMPVLRARGRLYRAFEDNAPLHWPRGFQTFVISAPEEADLLEAASWTMSNRIAMDPAWAPSSWKPPMDLGWLEGNVVETPAGEIWNLLRVHSDPEVDQAALVRVEEEGQLVTFDPESGFIPFPGGMSKFTIRRDPISGLYLTLTNNNTNPDRPWRRHDLYSSAWQRNVLSLYASEDLLHWRFICILLEDDSGRSIEDSLHDTGFQYADWQFDGDDLICLVRTAHGGAPVFHDSNRITFHRLEGFRSLEGIAMLERSRK